MADIRSQVFSPCARLLSKKGNVRVKFGDLLERLLLFDKYILQSHRLAELPHLVRQFGYDAVMELLRSGAIAIHNDIMTVGSLKEGGKRIKDSYRFQVFRFKYADSRQRDLDRAQQELRLNHLRKKLLLREVEECLVKYPEDSERVLQNQFISDISSVTLALQSAIYTRLQERVDDTIGVNDIQVGIESDSEGNVRTESNLSQLTSLNDEEIHEVLEQAILAIGGLNERILQMRSYSALTGFNESDVRIFESKLAFLESQFSADAQSDRLHKVVSIAGLPDLREVVDAERVDLLKLLELREQSEIKEFRQWLWSADSLSDKEVTERIGGFRAKLAQAARSRTGKTLRWLTTTAWGVVEPMSALGASALDTFLIERILPKSGISTFIGSQYPSIFRDKP